MKNSLFSIILLLVFHSLFSQVPKLSVEDQTNAQIEFKRIDASGALEQNASGGALRLQHPTIADSTLIQLRTYGHSYFNGGNVGIGTTSPDEKLHVDGNVSITGDLDIGTSADPAPQPGTIRWTNSDFLGWNGSDWISLTGGPLVDIDNNSYEIATIGSQVWMAENLKVTRYNDGTPIPLVTDNTAWSSLTTPGCTWYNNGGEAPEYGALYNYYAVADTNSRNVCPTGWHVPGDAEWINLTDYLGGSGSAGGKMKERGLAHWHAPNTGATNETGFTGLPAGGRGTGGIFRNLTTEGDWWSSTGSSSSEAYYQSVAFISKLAYRYISDKRLGLSVRCVKD